MVTKRNKFSKANYQRKDFSKRGIYNRWKIRQSTAQWLWWLKLTKKINAKEFDGDFDKLIDEFNKSMESAIDEGYAVGYQNGLRGRAELKKEGLI